MQAANSRAEASLPITSLPVTVQLTNSEGPCWDAVYGTGVKKNETGQFKATAE